MSTAFTERLIRFLAQDGHPQAYAALAGPVLEAVEAKLGYPLPPALKAVYAQVGNGGFGPAYGLLGLEGGAVQEDAKNALQMYAMFRQEDPCDPLWRWPDGLLPLVHLGCAMFLCVDCTDEKGRITWFEPNPHVDGEPWDDSMFPSDVTFEQMMEAWMEGTDVIELVGSSWEAKHSA